MPTKKPKVKPEYVYRIRGVVRHVGGEKKPFELCISAHGENHAAHLFWNSVFAPTTIGGKVRSVRLTGIARRDS